MEAYITHMLILIGIYAILTMGQNIVLGYTGLFGIAQAAFYGIGAYTSALLVLKLGVPFWGGLLAGALMGGLMGWALGLCTMRPPVEPIPLGWLATEIAPGTDEEEL